jgi:hypothetical protein
MFVKQLAQQNERHSECRELERRDRVREIDQPTLSSEVEDSQRAGNVQALSFRGNYTLAVIHQQQVGMESEGQCDSRGFALVNSRIKRDRRRLCDFKPGGDGSGPA